MYTKERIEEIAREEARNFLPTLENSNPAHFEGIVAIVKKTIIDDWALDILGSEEHVRNLMQEDLRSLKEALI